MGQKIGALPAEPADCAPGMRSPYCRAVRSGLSLRMAIGLVTGLTLGAAAHLALGDSAALEAFVSHVTEPAGRIFLRLLFMLVIPLILSALALGVAALGDLRGLKRIGLKTLAYTVVVSTIAVVIGVGLTNLLHPGVGLAPELRERLGRHAQGAPVAGPSAGSTGADLLVHLVS